MGKRPRSCSNPKKKSSKPEHSPLEQARERYSEISLIYDLLQDIETLFLINIRACWHLTGATDTASCCGGWSAQSNRHTLCVLLVQAINPDVFIYFPENGTGYSSPWKADPEIRICKKAGCWGKDRLRQTSLHNSHLKFLTASSFYNSPSLKNHIA